MTRRGRAGPACADGLVMTRPRLRNKSRPPRGAGTKRHLNRFTAQRQSSTRSLGDPRPFERLDDIRYRRSDERKAHPRSSHMKSFGMSRAPDHSTIYANPLDRQAQASARRMSSERRNHVEKMARCGRLRACDGFACRTTPIVACLGPCLICARGGFKGSSSLCGAAEAGLWRHGVKAIPTRALPVLMELHRLPGSALKSGCRGLFTLSVAAKVLPPQPIRL